MTLEKDLEINSASLTCTKIITLVQTIERMVVDKNV